MPLALAHAGLCACVCAALYAASPTTASAQQPPAPTPIEDRAHAARGKGYACVDPADALARRRLQDEPCRLPMVHMPQTPMPGASEPRRWPSYPSRSSDAQEGHAMFWRFPVQPMGPHEVPRHSGR